MVFAEIHFQVNIYLRVMHVPDCSLYIGVVIFKSQVEYYLFEGNLNHETIMQDEDNYFRQQIDHSF